MNKEELKKYSRLIVDKYDVSRFTDAIPDDCVMPGYFSGNKVLFVAQNPGLLKTDTDDEYFDAYCDKDYDKLEILYAKALKSKRGTYGIFINDIYDDDWSSISFTNVFKCPFQDNIIPKYIPAREIKILENQILLVEPLVIVAVGAVARDAMKQIEWLVKDKVMTVRHPSYLKRIGEYEETVNTYKVELTNRLHATSKPIQR